ncbi:MAG: YdcF family protein [Pseudoxanthomonas suwonensis]|nr:YdcF family protein [Pseudoxanthomonas suwonensis]
MPTRLRHRLNLFMDRDVLHVGGVALAACVLSGGLVYAVYFAHVLWIARRAPVQPQDGGQLLVFGKHAPAGQLDADFTARIERALAVWRRQPPAGIVLLGGGPAGAPTEAALARDALWARGLCQSVPLLLEDASRDTLQNLRNARALLHGGGVGGPVVLLSSRYHLARCAWFARQLGFDARLCAAEPRLRWSSRTLVRLAGEAAYVCLTDIGTRWARLIGARRILARIS